MFVDIVAIEEIIQKGVDNNEVILPHSCEKNSTFLTISIMFSTYLPTRYVRRTYSDNTSSLNVVWVTGETLAFVYRLTQLSVTVHTASDGMLGRALEMR